MPTMTDSGAISGAVHIPSTDINVVVAFPAADLEEFVCTVHVLRRALLSGIGPGRRPRQHRHVRPPNLKQLEHVVHRGVSAHVRQGTNLGGREGTRVAIRAFMSQSLMPCLLLLLYARCLPCKWKWSHLEPPDGDVGVLVHQNQLLH